MKPLELLQNKEENYVIYEDSVLFAVLVKRPMVAGHVKIYAKKEVKYIEELSDLEINHLFTVSSYVATAIFEGVGAHGTNIILNNGFDDNFVINVIPRTDGDGINFQWDMKQAKPEDLESVQKKLKQHTDFIGFSVPEEEPTVIQKEIEEEPEEEDYRIRQINKIP